MALFLCIAGAALVLFGLRTLSRATGNENPNRVTGLVIGYVQTDELPFRVFFYPIVKYTWRGTTFHIKSHMALTRPLFPVGTKLPVRVRTPKVPGEPPRAILDLFATRTVAWITLLLGFFLTVSFGPLVTFDFFSIVPVVVVAFQWGLLRRATKSGKLSQALVTFLHHEPLPAESIAGLPYVPRATLLAHFEKRTRQNRAFGLFLVVIALGIGAAGIKWFETRKEFLDASLAAEGLVVKTVRASGKSRSHYPIVQFRAPASEAPVEFRHPIGSSFPTYRVGDPVIVRYRQDNPSDAMIDPGELKYLGPSIVLAIAMLLLWLGWRIVRHGSLFLSE